MKRPRILITNDDGIHAPGIRQLWEVLHPIADVTVVAPMYEQSAVGLSITIRHPLQIEKVLWLEGAPVWSVSGTPADCVKLALSVILEEQPDLILSGINRGSNAGRNIFYSGTVAGVIEGIMHNIPGAAFSCTDFIDPNYANAARYVPGVVEHLLEHPLPEGTFLNINFPDKKFDAFNGFKLARQGKEMWGENPDKRLHPMEGHTYYWLGAKLLESEEHEESDITWLKKGFVTAVPVHVGELTDHLQLRSRKEHFEGVFDRMK